MKRIARSAIVEHANIESFLSANLKNPFQRGRGGPGGWWILFRA